MDHRNKKSRPEGRAAGLSLLTIVSIAGTVICITKARADFIDRYADLGLSGAIFSYRLPLAFAACAVIFSLIYLAERSISKAQRKSTRRSLIRQANEAGLNPMILEEADEQAKAKALPTKILDMFTRIIILLFIIFMIYAGLTVKTMIAEYGNRPVLNLLDYLEASDIALGYDGAGYIDEEKITCILPENIIDIYKTSPNYDPEKDYRYKQELWYRVRNDLTLTISPDTSEGGSLSNGDTVTVTIDLPGHSLESLEKQLEISIEGLGGNKEFTVSGLPHRYSDVQTLINEKYDLIAGMVEKLRTDAYSSCDNFQGDTYSSYTFDKIYLCRPDQNEENNPDALLAIAHYTMYPGTEYETVDSGFIYIYPLDSTTGTECLDINFTPMGEDNPVYCQTVLNNYTTAEKIKENFEAGIYLSADTSYTLTEIPW